MALSNFSWVIPHKLAGSDMPGSGNGNEETLQSDIAFLANQGIKLLVSLERPYGSVEKICSDNGIIWRFFSVADFGIPLNVSSFSSLVEECVQSVTSGAAVCAHCRAGIGRTGLLLGCIIGKYFHLDGHQAIAAVRQARSAIETQEQESFICSFLNEYET